MAEGDSSPFSIADAALWDVLRDTATAAGASLQAWRAEQDLGSGTHPGRDFDSGELVALADLRDTDFPALFVDDGTAVPPDGEPSYHLERLEYTKTIMGVLRARRDESTVSKKLKRFADLVWRVIAAHRGNCFGDHIVGANPIHDVALGSLAFPPFVDNEGDPVFAFIMELRLTVEIPSRV